jgi:glycyl-tRNA synthetase beta chain
MAELLLELFSEEIPARLQAKAADDLKRLIGDQLKASGLAFTRAEVFVTPRRLALVIGGLPEQQPNTTEERKGPRADAPPPAIDGFLKSTGLTREQIEVRETDKGAVLFAVIKTMGRPTAKLLADIIPEHVRSFPWPKSQRWGSGSLRWVRPLQSIICLLDGKIVDFDIDGIQAGNITRGHRFLAPDAFAVADFADYKAKLLAAKVVLDPAERRAKILADARALTAGADYQLIEDQGLLDEVAGLVEWPVVLMGAIDAAFMDVPAEALMATMRANQKYFSLRDRLNGKLAPRFIVVSNMETADSGRAIVAGNERVLRARLSDAKFFWDLDRKTPLEARLPALDDIIFHAKLGTVGARTRRMEQLVEFLAPYVRCNKGNARRAARLAKADLVSGMVGEFPELQGIMGRYYALDQGEEAAVADAIAEHYSPKGPSDICPRSSVSVAVALAEKIDTLTGFFLIDEKPTGSKDPYALRRAALGVIRLIVENGLRMGLAEILERAAFLHGVEEAEAVANPKIEDLLAFFADRLKVHLRDQGARHDLVSAIFELGDEDDLVRLLARVEALKTFLASDDGANLLTAYKRASNIVRIEEKKDDCLYDGDPDPGLFTEKEEKDLHHSLGQVVAHAKAAARGEKFEEAMGALATLRGPVDAFFDTVTVNCDDEKIRRNRLRILSQIRAALHAVADFSKIEG